jgi:two-component system cell cycle sensor histidine kinase/response regulator CckA
MEGRNTSGAPLDSAEFWRAVAEAVPELILILEPDGTVIYANRAPTELEREAVLGDADLASPPARAELRTRLTGIFANGLSQANVERVALADGTAHWCSVHVRPVAVAARIAAAMLVARDITSSREARLELAESEARFRTLVENAPEAIVVFDVDERVFVAVNSNACELFGLPADQLLRKNPVVLSPPTQPDGMPSEVAAEMQLEAALSGAIPSFEWIHRNALGVDIRCEIRLVRLPSATQRLVRGSIIDITERRRLEEHLREWQKMDALGNLAAGIAHDFNNVLSVVTASAEFLMKHVGNNAEATVDARAILDAARQGSTLTGQLLTFARRHGGAVEKLDLNDAVRDVTTMARRIIQPGIHFALKLDSRGAPVSINRGQLDQVLMNLLLNARDAMPSGRGTITVSTSRDTAHVYLRVTDTGTGMTEETRQRIFEPFFTTKGMTGGSGLGLSTVYAIVDEAGGKISVSSAPGQGARFEIELPLAAS